MFGNKKRNKMHIIHFVCSHVSMSGICYSSEQFGAQHPDPDEFGQKHTKNKGKEKARSNEGGQSERDIQRQRLKKRERARERDIERDKGTDTGKKEQDERQGKTGSTRARQENERIEEKEKKGSQIHRTVYRGDRTGRKTDCGRETVRE